MIYLDLAKAFDKVDHGLLDHRIKQKRITEKVGLWLYDFLCNRTQTILANDILSEKFDVKSGVPQGTVLGPVLFLLLLDNLGDLDIDSTIKSFADDTKTAEVIKNLTDVEHNQDNLEKIVEWQYQNKMEFNTKKFKLIQVGKNDDLS